MDEEETFYIVTHLIENIIPPDYYNSMTGVLCDDKLLDFLMKMKVRRLKDKMVEMGVQTSIFSVQWLVCLYTFYGFNKKLSNTIMDYLLAFGADSLL
jgi:Rab-GTPase-TBC domain